MHHKSSKQTLTWRITNWNFLCTITKYFYINEKKACKAAHEVFTAGIWL